MQFLLWLTVLGLASSAMAIRCYERVISEEGMTYAAGHSVVKDNYVACLRIFDAVDYSYTLGGVGAWDRRWDNNKFKGKCERQVHPAIIKGEFDEFIICSCMQDLCNPPMEYTDFIDQQKSSLLQRLRK